MVTDSDGVLQLSYAFYPVPNPIRASLGGINPVQSTCDLLLVISNSTLDTIAVSSITITIPTGDSNDTGDLSASALPAPSPASQPTSDGTDTWLFSTSGDVVTIQTQSGNAANFTLSTALVFTLPGIVVNEAPGTVQLSITETAPPAPPVTDNSTYTLLKLPADFPIVNFYVDPPTLSTYGYVTLHWECSSQGQNYSYDVYAVESPVLPAKGCLKNANDCYTCLAGQQGVQTTQMLTGLTAFALDVIEADSHGHRSIYQTIQTPPVPVLVPSISGASYKNLAIGRVVQLEWLTANATSCTVLLNGNIIDDNAPANTYGGDYKVLLTGAVGTYQLSVIPYDQNGIGGTPYTFPDINVPGTSVLAVGRYPMGVAVTPDSKLALVANGLDSSVSVIDLATLQVESATLPVGVDPDDIAITPDGSLALVNGYASVTVVDIAKRQVESNTLPVDQSPSCIAITPDGSLALVGSGAYGTVRVIDIAKRQVEPTAIAISNSVTALAITPDGSLALVVNENAGNVSVIDIKQRQVESHVLPVGNNPAAIAITPDGTLALVTNSAGNNVSVLDIATRTVETTMISVGQNPVGIAITPDGSLALVVNGEDNTVSLIDIANRAVASTIIPVGQDPGAIAIAPNGTYAVVTNFDSNSTTLL